MNLPNKLTMLRVILIPFFVLFMLLSTESGVIDSAMRENLRGFLMWRILSVLVFLGASFTDFLDGYIARKYNYITDFGKFMDPLADKLLVCSALILFTAERSLPAWVVIIIIAREFIISGFRMLAAEKGRVIAAGLFGKVKTVFQMILCVVLILPGFPFVLGSVVMGVLIAVVVMLSVVSLLDYVYKNISVIKS